MLKKVFASFKPPTGTENRHVMCVVEKAGFEPRTLGTGAERATNCATAPVIYVTLLFNVVYPLTFKLLIHVIGCDNCLTSTYDNADDVVIFSGVGSIPKSPHEGVENSLVLINKLPLSKNNVGLNFNLI